MSDDDLAARRVGTTLNHKYRLDRVLGCGGMAAVYAATHRNRSEVAIKVLHPELAAQQDIRERFLREGYVANSVGHPGAVSVLDDAVDEQGTPYLVMELLQGSSLESLAEQLGGTLPLVTFFRVGQQLLAVLQAAHERGIVHRDIKPDNVFFTVDGQVKVLDFGIARLREPTAISHTRTGLMMGTPGYMPPEQALGDTKHVDARTDVWAVGATLFRLLSGELPGGDIEAMDLYRFAMEGARPLRTVLPSAPAEVASVIDRALAQKREDRWPSAATMADALEAARRSIFSETLPGEVHSGDQGPATADVRPSTGTPEPSDPPLEGRSQLQAAVQVAAGSPGPDVSSPPIAGSGPSSAVSGDRAAVRPGGRGRGAPSGRLPDSHPAPAGSSTRAFVLGALVVLSALGLFLLGQRSAPPHVVTPAPSSPPPGFAANPLPSSAANPSTDSVANRQSGPVQVTVPSVKRAAGDLAPVTGLLPPAGEAGADAPPGWPVGGPAQGPDTTSGAKSHARVGDGKVAGSDADPTEPAPPKPAAAPPRHARPRRRSRSRSTRLSSQCALLLQRVSLGEMLSPAETKTLSNECR